MSFDIAYCSFVADHRQLLNVRRIALEHERNPKGASKAVLKEELTKGAQCLRRLLASPPYLSELSSALALPLSLVYHPTTATLLCTDFVVQDDIQAKEHKLEIP